VSDGLITDLEKLINNQRLNFILDLKSIPISINLKKLLNSKKLKKLSYISQGDDYQVLFTASPDKSGIISKISKTLGIKISKIGTISSHSQKSQIIDQKGKKIATKNKGYYHRF
jgi:thiamine-monophosphate kinase